MSFVFYLAIYCCTSKSEGTQKRFKLKIIQKKKKVFKLRSLESPNFWHEDFGGKSYLLL